MHLINQVILELRAQGRPSAEYSLEGGLKCFYRGPNGSKCAVGLLIKDEFYTPDLENLNANDPMVIEALEKSGFTFLTYNDTADLMTLQSIHDQAARKYFHRGCDWDTALTNAILSRRESYDT